MAANKVYAFQPDDSVPDREVSFDLNNEHFDCLPEVSGLLLLQTVTGMRDDDPASMATVILGFLTTVIPDYARFEQTVNKPRSGVGLEQLTGIVTDLLGEYMDFPTSPPAP